MRFWQAIVVAQMAAGSVYADRFASFWTHLSIEAGGILFGYLLWCVCSRLFPTTPPPCGLAPASSEGDRE